jgi:hypothetical protein
MSFSMLALPSGSPKVGTFNTHFAKHDASPRWPSHAGSHPTDDGKASAL